MSDQSLEIGLYIPVPHVVSNSDEMVDAVVNAESPLPTGGRDRNFELARDIALAADQAGYSIGLFAERLLGPDLEAWMLASAVASHTGQMRIMPAIHPSLWYPTMAAKMLASLDRIAPGRSAINLVTGWWHEENKMFGGGGLEDAQDKYQQAAEFVEVINALWEPGPCTYSGEVFQVEDAEIRLKPGSHPPGVYAASRSDEGLEMVARVADWWFIDYGNHDDFEETLDHARKSMARMDELSAKHDRKIKFAVNAFVVPGDTEQDAKRRAEEIRDRTYETHPKVAMIQVSGMSAGLVGTQEQILERIQALEDIGVELVLTKSVPTRENFAEITDLLEPRLRQRRAEGS